MLVLRNRGVQKQWLVFYFCGRILNLINSKRLGVTVALPVIVQAFNWLGLPHRVWVSAVTPEAKLHTHTIGIPKGAVCRRHSRGYVQFH